MQLVLVLSGVLLGSIVLQGAWEWVKAVRQMVREENAAERANYYDVY